MRIMKRLTSMFKSTNASPNASTSEVELNEDYYPQDEEKVEKGEGKAAFRVVPPWLITTSVTLGVLLALFIFGALIPTLFHYLYQPPDSLDGVGVCSVHRRLMVECFPGVVEVTKYQCYRWDCCWRDDDRHEDADGSLVPRCYHRVPSSYRFVPETNTSSSKFPLTLRPFHSTSIPGLPADYHKTRIRVRVNRTSVDVLRLRISLIEDESVDDGVEFDNVDSGDNNDTLYKVSAMTSTSNGCVNVTISRRSTERIIFWTNCIGGLIVTRNYSEFTIVLSNGSSIYGLGFINEQSLLRPMTGRPWTLSSNIADFGKGDAGGHPKYLCVETDGNAHGVLLDTSRVLDIRLLTTPALVIRSTEVDFDFYVALGPTPVDAVEQLTSIKGVSDRPALPPYWALGFHLCPIGNVSVVELIRKMNDENIPLESHCIDAEAWQKLAFEDNVDHVVDNERFREAVEELRSRGQKILAVAFPQVAITKPKSTIRTFAFDSGKNADIFLPSVHGRFWGDVSVSFPDLTNPDTIRWMSKFIENMSMFSGFEFDGYIEHWDTPLDLRNHTAHPCDNRELNLIPYVGVGNLSDNTLCLDVRYYSNQTHSQVYNKYGQSHLSMMRDAVSTLRPDERPFLLSLSTHLSTGHFGGTWGGMYPSTWSALRQSLIHVQEASIYGIPLTGVPICGHLGVAEIELCGRWLQTGIFNPLAISFYDSTEHERNPLSFNKALASFAGLALRLRYSLLPYLYTLFYHAHIRGTPVLRPLFFEFPQYPQIRSQVEPFLWGGGLLFIPNLDQGRASVSVWLPHHVCWYEYYSGKRLDFPAGTSNGTRISVASPIYYVNLFVRGGHVVVTQRGNTTTDVTRRAPYVVYVGLDCQSENNTSKGQLVIDDGISMNSPRLIVDFESKNDGLTITPTKSDANVVEYLTARNISVSVAEVRVYGVKGNGELAVFVDGREVACKSHRGVGDECNFNVRLGVLVVRYLMELSRDHKVEWTWA